MDEEAPGHRGSLPGTGRMPRAAARDAAARRKRVALPGWHGGP